ncbi:hypothetical protein J0D95_002077 [Salmonella enterica]|nr:hypothetical protein [Salmonella enterica]
MNKKHGFNEPSIDLNLAPQFSTGKYADHINFGRSNLIKALENKSDMSYFIMTYDAYSSFEKENKNPELLEARRHYSCSIIILFYFEKSFNFNEIENTNMEKIELLFSEFISLIYNILDQGYYFQPFLIWGILPYSSTESQVHREFISALNLPVGFECQSLGKTQLAINGIISASSPHNFIGVDYNGRISQIISKGNPHCYLVIKDYNTSTEVNYNTGIQYFDGSSRIIDVAI